MGKLAKERLFSDLGYAPHPGQLLVHRSKAKRRVLAAGSRWGKSVCAAMECVAAALEPCDESRGWVIAPTFDLASRVFLRVQAAIQEHLPHRLIKLNEREHVILLRNMGGGVSEIRAKSADRPVTLLGEALDWLVLDEAARVPESVWETCLAPRLLDRDGWALLISTPRGPGWFHRAFRAGRKGRTPGCESWNAPTAQNPHVPASVIEEERARLTSDAYAQEYLGRFLGVEDEACFTCGGPSPKVSGVLIVHNGEPIHTCVECRKPVDALGRTLVNKTPGEKPRLTIIRVCTQLGEAPAMPFDIEEAVREGGDWEPFDMDDRQVIVEEDAEDIDGDEPVSPADLERILRYELHGGRMN